MRPFPFTAITGLLLLANCGPSLDELKAEPVQFTARSAVPFETMANCLVARSMDDFLPSPQIYADRGVAYVTLNHRQAMSIFAEYTVTRSGDGSTVEYRRRKLIATNGGDDRARATVAGCSKATS